MKIQVKDVSKNGPLRAEYNSIYNTNNKVIVVHEAKAIPFIHEIVKEFNPELIIELGTSWGGVTLILHECNINAKLHSYDINCPRKPNRSMFNENVYFHIEDILSSSSNSLMNLCKDRRKKVLYCDNGNKIKEIQTYAPYLNVGDLLGVHDWDKEIRYKDVENVLKYFKPIKHEIFEKNNWSTRFFEKQME
jgi:cephalosporin hydroxylase